MRKHRKIGEDESKSKLCFGSLKQNDHNFGLMPDECLWCGISRAEILEENSLRAFEEALKKIK
jgi:hypothetical protein